MIDLSLMKGIRVDPVRRTAWVEPGVTWNELDRETQAFGLATTGGTVSHTGVAGLTLGGGIGWLMAKHGLACDNLLSVDIVTATGELLKASETENSDLFWAIRGGGGNFGIVNHLDADDSQLRTRAAYGDNYERLVAIKNKYDPTNFFRLNNNIAPTGD
ncbi:MAG: FAD-binding oxidoreductase [Caldilineaceae bacterium]|nr:FAD-binding oxidoreductase [Caldilineaceae bacterium]